MNKPTGIFQLSALKIVLLYLILSLIWIIYTDQWVEGLADDPVVITTIQTWKGAVFILMTALLLYWLIRRSEQAFLEKHQSYESETQKLLGKSEEQYRRLFEENPYPMWIYDPVNKHFLEVNQSAVLMYGYSKEEFYKMTLYKLHPEEERARLKKKLEEGVTGLVRVDGWTHITRTGERRIVNVSAMDITFEARACRLVVANDVTNQRKAEEKAISSLMEGGEAERRRIAKDLHDGLGQYLAAAGMNLESAYDEFDDLSDDRKLRYKKGLKLLAEAVTETRRISQNLLPKAIEDFGLSLAVASWIDDLKKSFDVEIHYRETLGDRTFSEKLQLNLYRILQESMNNALRHSGCSRIDVQLSMEDAVIRCMVEDDGHGFDPDVEGDHGLGLASIRNRVYLIGGDVDIFSRPGAGTCISVTVPVNSVS